MLSLLLLLSCETTATQFVPTCALSLPTFSTDTVSPGESVVVTTSPLTAKNDTIVTFGSRVATVTALDRSTCAALDACRAANSCTDCGSCDACAADSTSCVEKLTVTTPDLADGHYAVAIRNAHGQSPNATLNVVAGDSGLDSGVDSGADSGTDSAP